MAATTTGVRRFIATGFSQQTRPGPVSAAALNSGRSAGNGSQGRKSVRRGRRPLSTALSILAALTIVWAKMTMAAAACPFCPQAGPTYSEQLATADAVVLTAWKQSIEPRSDEDEPRTEFAWLETVKSPNRRYGRDDVLSIPTLRNGRPGDLFLLWGHRGEAETIEWTSPLEVSEVSYAYLRQAPSPEQGPNHERLRYFLKFLESSNELIANDAFAEFSRSRFEDVLELRGELPLGKLRNWLASPDTLAIRKGFYGMLLGLCGTADDAEFLAGIVLAPPRPDQNRIGIDGMMGGYVLLTRSAGLDRLLSAKLDSSTVDDGEVFAVLNLLRFLHDFAPTTVDSEQLGAAMRRLLDIPAVTDSVIVDLARWQDWSVLPRLIEQFGQPPFDAPSTQEKIVRYVLTCEKQSRMTSQESLSVQCRAFLEQLKQTNPQLLETVQRQMRPRSLPMPTATPPPPSIGPTSVPGAQPVP
jgi:hypothetical protein